MWFVNILFPWAVKIIQNMPIKLYIFSQIQPKEFEKELEATSFINARRGAKSKRE